MSTNNPFTRTLKLETIETLKDDNLYKLLLKDIQKKEVFPAIRNETINFYHKGGRLFEYTGTDWKTNSYYIPAGKESRDVQQTKLPKMESIKTFADGYETIKKRCAKYNAKTEAAGVAALYKKFSYATSSEDIVLLDIESAFSSKDENKAKASDRLDIILFNKKTGMLQAVEAKLYGNPEIRGEVPKVVGQIRRYQDTIQSRRGEILSAYGNYPGIVKRLFGVDLPEVRGIHETVSLLCFDFDDKAWRSAEYKEKKFYLEHNNINVHLIGSTTSFTTLSRFF